MTKAIKYRRSKRSYLELLAQSKGLGTLWNGIAKYVIDVIKPSLREVIGINENEKIGYMMLLGYPNVKYTRAKGKIKEHVISVNI